MFMNIFCCSFSQQEWGKISSLFLEHEWRVVELALLHSSVPWCDVLELLTLAEDTLSVGVEETTVIVLKCLRIIIPKVITLILLNYFCINPLILT